MLEINVLNSHRQYLGGFDPKEDRMILGLDSEILLKKGKETLWPHMEKCPQERGVPSWAGDQCDWHGDGYAFELCIEPTHCLDQVLHHVAWGMHFMTGRYAAQRNPIPMCMEVPTVYAVPKDVIAGAPAEVKRLGCAPSYNVYGDPGEPKSLKDNERTTGCHLHVSHKWLDDENAQVCVKWADIVVGNIWNVISNGDPEIEAARRRAYGRAGEHRRNVYPSGAFGFEYRVLPGAVLGHPVYLTLMYNLIRHAVHMAHDQGEPNEALAKSARIAINTADKKLSQEVMDQLVFEKRSLKFLKYLEANPLPVLTLRQWSEMGMIGHGHISMNNVLMLKGLI